MNNTSLKSTLLPGTLIPFVGTSHDIVLHVEDIEENQNQDSEDLDFRCVITTIYFSNGRIEVTRLLALPRTKRFRNKNLMFNVE